ncbi:MAG: DUF924 family protein [Halioglobus sp.]
MDTAIRDIHNFWFGPLDADGFCQQSYHSLWFKKSDATDLACREQFGDSVQQALAGDLDHWADEPPGLIALILLLDQFTRNIFRGTAQAFAGDQRALAAALVAIDMQQHLTLPAIHRVFLYMPLEHSEDMALQERCVSLFEALVEETGSADVKGFSRYAGAHRAVIAEFDRFPHRNVILGRESTQQELAYLAKQGGF